MLSSLLLLIWYSDPTYWLHFNLKLYWYRFSAPLLSTKSSPSRDRPPTPRQHFAAARPYLSIERLLTPSLERTRVLSIRRTSTTVRPGSGQLGPRGHCDAGPPLPRIQFTGRLNVSHGTGPAVARAARQCCHQPFSKMNPGFAALPPEKIQTWWIKSQTIQVNEKTCFWN